MSLIQSKIKTFSGAKGIANNPQIIHQFSSFKNRAFGFVAKNFSYIEQDQEISLSDFLNESNSEFIQRGSGAKLTSLSQMNPPNWGLKVSNLVI